MISLAARFNIVVDNEVTMNDVLLGRGAFVDRFQGNVKFRSLIRQYKESYRAALHHSGKAAIAQQIVNAVHAYQGRFLRKLELSNSSAERSGAEASGTRQTPVWEIVDNSVALEKVKQALRDIDQVDSKTNPKPTAHRCKSEGATAELNSELEANSSQASQIPRRMSGPATPSSRQGRHQEMSPLTKRRASETPRRNQESSSDPADRKPAAVVPVPRGANHLVDQTPRSLPEASAPSAPPRYRPDVVGRHDETLPVSQIERHQHMPTTHSAAATMFPPMIPTEIVAPVVEPMPQSHALSEALYNEVAFSWREIPAAFLELLPGVREGRIRPFSSEDLQVLLLTLGWVESARDWHRVAQIRTVAAAVLALPPPQLRLTLEEIECLMSVLQRL
jgi:hypothetical protein